VGSGMGVTVVPRSAVAGSGPGAGPGAGTGAGAEAASGVRVLGLADRAAVHRVGVVHRADYLPEAARVFLECIYRMDRSE
jgi:DNA-binding transcriptional LysR family regulator